MEEVIEQLKQRIEELKDSLHKHYSIEVESRLSELERTVTILCSCASINEDFESEWKRYCESKGGGAVTMNVKDVAKHFAEWQKEQMKKDAVNGEIEGDWRNQEDAPYAIYAVSDSLPLDGEIKYGDKVKVVIIKE